MLELKAEKRKESGKDTELLRQKGFVPVVLYGPKVDNLNLVVDEREFSKVFKTVGEASMLELKIGKEKKNRLVLVKDIQIHPVTDRLLHADFYQPILTEKVESTVPLVFEGQAPAVKEQEGVLVKNISEVVVSALPTDLPSEIRVDIGGLKNFDDVVCIRDLDLPQGVKVIRGEDEVVATVSAPKTAEQVMEEMERAEEEELFVGEEVPVEEEIKLDDEGEEVEGEEQEGIEL